MSWVVQGGVVGKQRLVRVLALVVVLGPAHGFARTLIHPRRSPACLQQQRQVVVNSSHEDKQVLSHERGMSLSLASTYFTVMGAKCALPAVLSLLMAPETGLTMQGSSNPQKLFSRLLTLSTLAIAAGKLLLGPVIDHTGGIRSLQIALASLAALLGLISVTQSWTVFGIAWIGVDFIFSSCWAACIQAIYQSFEPAKWARQIGILAAAARMGNAAAFALFSAVLHATPTQQPWRPVFWIASIIQLVPVMLLSYFGNQIGYNNAAAKSSNTHSWEESMTTLSRAAKTLDFWLHLINRSVMMVFASMLLFVPSYMTHVLGASSAVAARVGAIYACGCLISVTLGGPWYTTLEPHKKLWTLTCLLASAMASSIGQLAHVAGKWHLSVTASTFLWFVWGCAFGIPFYLPASMYALQHNGSATLADVFDIGGFGLLACFNYHVAGIPPDSPPQAWIPTFAITTACAVVSYLTLAWATWREKDSKA